MLRYVHGELGARLGVNVRATRGAAGSGQPGALQYALDKGAPWQDIEVLEAAVRSDSLACLRCFHEFAIHRPGYKPGTCYLPGGAGDAVDRTAPPAHGLAVLRYVCETIGKCAGSAWADQVVKATVLNLESKASLHRPVDWELVLYLARKVTLEALTPMLQSMAHKRRMRVFTMLQCISALPTEVLELIAFMAHLGVQPIFYKWRKCQSQPL